MVFKESKRFRCWNAWQWYDFTLSITFDRLCQLLLHLKSLCEIFFKILENLLKIGFENNWFLSDYIG